MPHNCPSLKTTSFPLDCEDNEVGLNESFEGKQKAFSAPMELPKSMKETDCTSPKQVLTTNIKLLTYSYYCRRKADEEIFNTYLINQVLLFNLIILKIFINIQN